VAEVHDRMPVILPRDAEDDWLDPDVPVEHALSLLEAVPVGRDALLSTDPRGSQDFRGEAAGGGGGNSVFVGEDHEDDRPRGRENERRRVTGVVQPALLARDRRLWTNERSDESEVVAGRFGREEAAERHPCFVFAQAASSLGVLLTDGGAVDDCEEASEIPGCRHPPGDEWRHTR
jgi:SOS response associated peptidase (SRAP)